MTFGSEYKSLRREHPIVIAILAGLDLDGERHGYISRGLSDSTDRSLKWVKGYWRSRVPTAVDEIMWRLERKVHDGCSLEAVNRWMACLCRYLQARKSPDEQDVSSRMQRFLYAISASPYLPIDALEKYEVRLIPFGFPLIIVYPRSICTYRSCFTRRTLPVIMPSFQYVFFRISVLLSLANQPSYGILLTDSLPLLGFSVPYMCTSGEDIPRAHHA